MAFANIGGLTPENQCFAYGGEFPDQKCAFRIHAEIWRVRQGEVIRIAVLCRILGLNGLHPLYPDLISAQTDCIKRPSFL